jgi:hypothetical protein
MKRVAQEVQIYRIEYGMMETQSRRVTVERFERAEGSRGEAGRLVSLSSDNFFLFAQSVNVIGCLRGRERER